MKVYRITVWSHYEEDDAEPYTVDYDSMPDALNAKEQYENELTIAGQHDLSDKEYSDLIKMFCCKGDSKNG